jgi:hypothetical protein
VEKLFWYSFFVLCLDVILIFVFLVENTPSGLFIPDKTGIYYPITIVAIICLYLMVYSKVRSNNQKLSKGRAMIYAAIILPLMMIAVHYINKY